MAQFSGHYLLDLLTKEDQQRFKLNYELEYQEFKSGSYGDDCDLKSLEDYLDKTFSGLNYFLTSAFYWSSTPEGADYWSEISCLKTQ